jgi:type IV pilus assembly protein PilB
LLAEETIEIPVALIGVLNAEQAWHYRILVKEENTNTLSLWIDEEKFSDGISDELEMLLGKSIHLTPLSSEQITRQLNKFYKKVNHLNTNRSAISMTDDFLGKLIIEARQLSSSDIHIEVYEDKARIRIRIDGMLVERYTISLPDYPALINKIKIKARLDISEKRLPQDGRIQFNENGYRIDIRVSILPTLHGEKIVLRLLGNDASNIFIEKLGFDPKQLKDYLEGIKKPHGIVLISGPTGSGKTTTLYATLKILNEEKRNILTVEDPIEYTLEGINQVQLKESIGLTFAAALRTFLRQDPDIIMLGEIRDAETAQMAIRAALTGHLVLSTIHTNSAWGTIARLTDMGIPPFLISNTINVSAAQRLIRLLCSHCKQKETFDKVNYPGGFKPSVEIEHHYTAGGCDDCYHTGYKGRKAVYEIIPIDFDIAESIRQKESSIDEKLKTRSIKLLSDSAFKLFAEGLTTIDEVYPLLMNQA